MNGSTSKGIARFFARQTLGFIFMMAGWWKCFELTPLEHAEKFFIGPGADLWVPNFILWPVGTVVPIIELLAGGLLILGLFQSYALLSLGAVLIIVLYGHLLMDPLFVTVSHIFPRTILLIIIFALPQSEDVWAIDSLFNKTKEE